MWFGTESNPFDPRSQSEQVGDNPMIAGKYGVKNLQRVIDNLEAWSTKPNEDYSVLADRYNQVSGQFSRYLGHVAKYIGGVMETPKTVEQKGAVYELVSKTEQKEALKFLNDYAFTTPNWILKKDVLNKINRTPVDVVSNLQNGVLNRILMNGVLENLNKGESIDINAYSLFDYLQDLKSNIFSELKTSSKIDIYRRNLQRSFVDNLLSKTDSATSASIIRMGSSDNSDVKALVRGTLRDIRNEASKAASQYSDSVTKYHLEDLVYRIDKALEVK